MKVAIEGCCHGELDKIYETLACLERRNNVKVDLLLICGDFQSVRNRSDLQAMAVPPKYQKMNTFYKYYSGEKKAPVLTVFIGGNHEASNYLQELPYGGWVATNIYYLGYAGVVQFGGVRIGGASGIYKGRDYNRGHFEHPPYSEDTKRSCYHIRNLEVFRLKQLKQPLDIFLSHDWPRGIYNHGNVNRLLQQKKFFREEVESGTLGSPPLEELLNHLKPSYWFAAHLHVKFAAVVEHQMGEGVKKSTKFLALDKCLPRRNFLQVIDIPHNSDRPLQLELDAEWLSILKSTNHLLNLTKGNRYMPGPGCSERYDFTPTETVLAAINEDFGGVLKIPDTFEQSVTPYHPNQGKSKAPPPQIVINSQTQLMCDMLGLIDPFAVFCGRQSHLAADANALTQSDDDSLDLDDRDEGIPDDSDFIDTTMETTINSTMETTMNPDEISLDDAEEASAENSPEEGPEAPPSDQPVDYSKATGRVDVISLEPPSMDFDKAITSTPLPGTSRSLDSATSEPSPATLSESLSSSSPEKRPQDMSDDPDTSVPNENPELGPSQPKKFKRRNASLYASTDGDDM